jgi:hypothetical protein
MVSHLQTIRTGGEVVRGLTRAQRERVADNKWGALRRIAERRCDPGAGPAAAVPRQPPPPPDREVEGAVAYFNRCCRRPLRAKRTANGLLIEATTLYAQNQARAARQLPRARPCVSVRPAPAPAPAAAPPAPAAPPAAPARD